MRTPLLAVALLAVGCATSPARPDRGEAESKPPSVRPERSAAGAEPSSSVRPERSAAGAESKGPRFLAEPEAIELATRYARAQGLALRRATRVRLDRNGRYHVALRGDGAKDSADVLVDGWSGEIMGARLRNEGPPLED